MPNNKSVKKNKKVGNKSASKRKKTENEKFNFEDEIVIGVNVVPQNKKDKHNKKKNNKEKIKTVKNKRKTKKVVQEVDNRKTNKKKNIIKIIVLAILIIGIIIFIMTTPLFNIKDIQVEGNSKITKERIESLSQIRLDVNTFKYRKGEIVKNIKEEPYIENVQIKRKLPNGIRIIVEERKPSFMVAYSNSYIYINSQGYILEISNEQISIPIIEGILSKQEELLPGKRLCDADLEKLNNVLKIVESAEGNGVYDLITKIDISDKTNYVLRLESNQKTVYLGDISNINDRILMLKEILKKEQGNAGEIFLNDLNKCYFRQEN